MFVYLYEGNAFFKLLFHKSHLGLQYVSNDTEIIIPGSKLTRKLCDNIVTLRLRKINPGGWWWGGGGRGLIIEGLVRILYIYCKTPSFRDGEYEVKCECADCLMIIIRFKKGINSIRCVVSYVNFIQKVCHHSFILHFYF